MDKGQVLNIAGAEKKLRQAEFFLGWLEQSSEATRQRSYGEEHEHLEFYLSACLSAAQSVYYILKETGGKKFKEIQRNWRLGLIDDSGGPRFGRMMGLRGEDVHFGTTGAKPLPKYVEDDRLGQSPYQVQRYNAALFGPAPFIEQVNPDGKKVRASVLRDTMGLYLNQRGTLVEATTACRDFINQLRSLLGAVKAAYRPDS